MQIGFRPFWDIFQRTNRAMNPLWYPLLGMFIVDNEATIWGKIWALHLAGPKRGKWNRCQIFEAAPEPLQQFGQRFGLQFRAFPHLPQCYTTIFSLFWLFSKRIYCFQALISPLWVIFTEHISWDTFLNVLGNREVVLHLLFVHFAFDEILVIKMGRR